MTHHFNEDDVLHKLRHFLPSQAPLKDFIHHNTLHAFQNFEFYDALRKSAVIFGNRTTLSLREYRDKFAKGEIPEAIVDNVILSSKSKEAFSKWKEQMFSIEEVKTLDPKIGRLRKFWEVDYGIDMDGMVRPNIIRIINSYLDQGIAFEGLPNSDQGLLDAVISIQNNSYAKILNSEKSIFYLNKKDKRLEDLLKLIVGDERYYEQYLFDQQYSHPGLSGLVCAIELKPDALFSERNITLFDIIYLELLFELESLEVFVSKNFKPLATGAVFEPTDLFEDVLTDDYWEVLELWQESFESTYHDQVLKGISGVKNEAKTNPPAFQAFFCIDDREESIRRNIEMLAPECQTFGTPAHFNIIARFKPENAKFSTQICPAPFTPTHLIKESNRTSRPKKDVHFQDSSHKFFSGFIISQTVGFLSTIKLFTNIFNPTESIAQYNATKDHMDYTSNLIYENVEGGTEDGFKVGFTLIEMIDIVFGELSNTGLTGDFAPLIYHFGHGGSSINNPYFAGYNCGACSGRPSTVNARLFAIIANRKDVREGLSEKGMKIPASTHFVGGYHDTTRDTFAFFDEDLILESLVDLHRSIKTMFEQALSMNAKERARQFKLIDIKKTPKKVHREVLKRALSLFEPRPEYNHSNNALFIVGDRKLTQNLFLDQRAFLNSYDYKQDKEGKLLENILNAGTGVCGGINLEYYFSSVDNEKLGAGSKLPQNVIGLYGVANGVKGDLRPGLPWQMVDVHDPIRILTVVENTPDMVLNVLKANPKTFDWYRKGWMKLSVYDPYTKEISILKNDEFVPYHFVTDKIETITDFEQLVESTHKNLPVYTIN
jgi:uncharacterized protein YbcC (UPF0753/DUF2309 family)